MRRAFQHIFVVATIIVIAGGVIYLSQRTIINHLNESRSQTGETIFFTIEQSETVNSVAERLHEEKLIRSPVYFRFRAQLTGQDQEIVAGRHELNTAMTTTQILDIITSEDNIAYEEITVRFVEGWRVDQYAEELVRVGLVTSTEEFIGATHELRWNNEFGFLHSRPSDVGLEGYLFPDTYIFRTDWTADQIIEVMLLNFQSKIPTDLQASASALGLTLHQALTLASIVERETSLEEERPMIASVYYNRLQLGMPLQADPTIQYATGTPEDWWPVITGDDLNQRGPYNTYLNPDLPPGPICNPGFDAINSAFGPAQTDFLFFVATGEGTHAFATTLEEHQENIDLYQSEETP